MATVRVRASDYIAGTLPDVSVMSGHLTAHRVTLTTPVVFEDRGRWPSWVLPEALDRLGAALRPTGPVTQVVLKGRVPVTPEEEARLDTRRRWSRIVAWSGLAVLVGAGLSEAPWAPAVAVATLLAMATALAERIGRRRAWPRPTVDRTQRWVTVHRVHDTFAAAVGDRTGDDEASRPREQT